MTRSQRKSAEASIQRESTFWCGRCGLPVGSATEFYRHFDAEHGVAAYLGNEEVNPKSHNAAKRPASRSYALA